MSTSRNGNATKCLRHEMAMLQNVYVTKWQCYKKSIYKIFSLKNVYVTKSKCILSMLQNVHLRKVFGNNMSTLQNVYATKCQPLECLRNKMSTIQNVYIYNVFARKFIN